MVSKTYNPKLVVVTFISTNLAGFADGQFIGVTKNEDGMTLKVGADGESAVAINANESGRVTLTLLNTSASNDFLSLQAALRSRGALQIKDLSGRLLVNAEDMWIVKVADVNKSKEVETNAWVFETGELVMANNGNL